jgi:hypothetical protein
MNITDIVYECVEWIELANGRVNLEDFVNKYNETFVSVIEGNILLNPVTTRHTTMLCAWIQFC